MFHRDQTAMIVQAVVGGGGGGGGGGGHALKQQYDWCCLCSSSTNGFPTGRLQPDHKHHGKHIYRT